MQINPGYLLIQRFCELYELRNDYASWSLKNFKDHEPGKVRLVMIRSLFKALNIKSGISDFVSGTFITEKHDIHALIQLILLNEEPVEEVYSWSSTGYLKNAILYLSKNNNVQYTFEYLLRYRMQLELLYKCYSNVVLGNPAIYLAMAVADHCNDKMRQHAKIVDDILAWFVNPLQSMVSLEELHTKYRYPDVDLEELDFDWR